MSYPFHVSEAASLALHAAALIAERGGEPVTSAEIASSLQASQAHLSKVLRKLSVAGLLNGATGPGGGFTLTRAPSEITLFDIYEAIEAPLRRSKCLFDLPVCQPESCPLSRLIDEVDERITEGLSRTTLEDFRVPSGRARPAGSARGSHSFR